jgi:mgtE-like transporter
VNRSVRLRRPVPPELLRRLVDLLGPTGDAARQSLLVMVPAAIGLRGNIFGALGNRLSTSIHTGTFRISFRRESVLGQNLAASLALTVMLSFALALVAKIVALGFGVEDVIGVGELVLI